MRLRKLKTVILGRGLAIPPRGAKCPPGAGDVACAGTTTSATKVKGKKGKKKKAAAEAEEPMSVSREWEVLASMPEYTESLPAKNIKDFMELPTKEEV